MVNMIMVIPDDYDIFTFSDFVNSIAQATIYREEYKTRLSDWKFNGWVGFSPVSVGYELENGMRIYNGVGGEPKTPSDDVVALMNEHGLNISTAFSDRHIYKVNAKLVDLGLVNILRKLQELGCPIEFWFEGDGVTTTIGTYGIERDYEGEYKNVLAE